MGKSSPGENMADRNETIILCLASYYKGSAFLQAAKRLGAKVILVAKDSFADEAWPRESLGDQQSFFLLEQFVAGDVFHVDGLVNDGEVLFMAAHQYGRPPMNVYHEGGIFLTRTLDHASSEAQSLFALNRQVQSALGMR